MAGKYKEDETMTGCKGETYAERKVDLLHQLGYREVTLEMFEGLNDVQIDQKARSIIKMPTWEFNRLVKQKVAS